MVKEAGRDGSILNNLTEDVPLVFAVKVVLEAHTVLGQ